MASVHNALAARWLRRPGGCRITCAGASGVGPEARTLRVLRVDARLPPPRPRRRRAITPGTSLQPCNEPIDASAKALATTAVALLNRFATSWYFFLALARNSPATGRGIDRLPARLPAVHGSLIIVPSRTAKMVKANAAPPPPPPTGPGIYSATYSGVSMSSLHDRESRIATGTIHLGCWITMGGRALAPPPGDALENRLCKLQGADTFLDRYPSMSSSLGRI